MRCPRCKVEYKTLDDNNKLVSHKMDICVFCGFIFGSDESKQFKIRCAEMIMRHITDFKRTGNVASVYRADTYFQTLLEEVYDDVD